MVRKVKLQNGTTIEVSEQLSYDPESLLTGEEITEGLGYEDLRVWPSLGVYLDATAGRLTLDQIPSIAPRVKSAQAIVKVDTRQKLGRIN